MNLFVMYVEHMDITILPVFNMCWLESTHETVAHSITLLAHTTEDAKASGPKAAYRGASALHVLGGQSGSAFLLWITLASPACSWQVAVRCCSLEGSENLRGASRENSFTYTAQAYWPILHADSAIAILAQVLSASWTTKLHERGPAAQGRSQ